MAAQPIIKPQFYIQWQSTEDGEWRYSLVNGDFAYYQYFPLAASTQMVVALEHPNCPTRVVDQFGNVYGTPFTIAKVVA